MFFVLIFVIASVVDFQVVDLMVLGSCDDKFLLLDSEVFCAGRFAVVKNRHGVGCCATRRDSIHLDVLFLFHEDLRLSIHLLSLLAIGSVARRNIFLPILIIGRRHPYFLPLIINIAALRMMIIVLLCFL